MSPPTNLALIPAAPSLTLPRSYLGWVQNAPPFRLDVSSTADSATVNRRETSGQTEREPFVTNLGELLYEAKNTPSGLALEKPLATSVRVASDLALEKPLATSVRVTTAAAAIRPELRVTTAAAAIRPELRVLARGNFKLLQSWQGVVVEVTASEFVAQIRDKTVKDNPVEEVSLPIEEVTPSEQDQIVPGAVFYWSIGYKDAPGEPRRRVSQIRFRRLPPWTEAELAAARQEADELKAFLLGDAT